MQMTIYWYGDKFTILTAETNISRRLTACGSSSWSVDRSFNSDSLLKFMYYYVTSTYKIDGFAWGATWLFDRYIAVELLELAGVRSTSEGPPVKYCTSLDNVDLWTFIGTKWFLIDHMSVTCLLSVVLVYFSCVNSGLSGIPSLWMLRRRWQVCSSAVDSTTATAN